MPLPPSVEREELHQRLITMKAWRRVDGMFDVEARLVDTKPFEFQRLIGETTPAGAAVHDLWVRLVIDADFVVREITATSDTTPFAICRDATATLAVLVGERIGPGWPKVVRERLRGAAGCTHLSELMAPLATTALQGIRAVLPRQAVGADTQQPRSPAAWTPAMPSRPTAKWSRRSGRSTTAPCPRSGVEMRPSTPIASRMVS